MPNQYPPGWAKNATTPAPPTETIFDQSYTPDWAKVPVNCEYVAVDPDGDVFGHTSKPYPHTFGWISNSYLYIGTIDARPGDTWKTMIYQRPTNTTA